MSVPSHVAKTPLVKFSPRIENLEDRLSPGNMLSMLSHAPSAPTFKPGLHRHAQTHAGQQANHHRHQGNHVITLGMITDAEIAAHHEAAEIAVSNQASNRFDAALYTRAPEPEITFGSGGSTQSHLRSADVGNGGSGTTQNRLAAGTAAKASGIRPGSFNDADALQDLAGRGGKGPGGNSHTRAFVNGMSVSKPVNVSQAGGNQSEYAIAVNPTNGRELFAFSNTDGGTGLFSAYSKDGGKHWTQGGLADGNFDPFSLACCDPSASWDEFGNLFVTYLHTDPVNDITYAPVLLSTNGGRTFTQIDAVIINDQPTITAAGGEVHVLAEDQTFMVVYSARVFGKGSVGPFGPEEYLLDFGDPVNFGDIAVGPNGQIMVTSMMNDGGDGPSYIYSITDPDGLGGATFGFPTFITGLNCGSFDVIPPQSGRSIDAEPSLAWDRSGGPNTGRVYLVYVDEFIDEYNDMNIFIIHSDNNGATWSRPIRLNTDFTNFSQFNPAIAVDQKSGDVFVSWYDARNDPGAGPGDTDRIPNTDTQFYGAHSRDGGNTWREIRISSNTSNALAAASGTDYGDYSKLAFDNGKVHVMWADNSQNLPNNPSPGGAFDLATAVINVGRPPRSILDTHESNDTADKASSLGVLAGPVNVPNLSIMNKATYDRDWFTFTTAGSGPLTVDVNIGAGTDLDFRLYRLSATGSLIEVGKSATRVTGGTESVTVNASAGDRFYISVYGYRGDTGLYDLDITPP